MAIDKFIGSYRWLSNFTAAPVTLDGVVYPSTEHAYQAAKSMDESYRRTIVKTPKANVVKHMGQKVELRPDWEQVKIGVMEDLVRQKFNQPEFKELLKATGDQEIVEGNWWHDIFWGVCDGTCKHGPHEPTGQNNLGKLIMKVRAELV